ncbi:MAG: MATE family efflux transporter [Lachnospiraceae bacterium]|nr:MATE family efflux transporter [Lachnospiraceae bacterium]
MAATKDMTEGSPMKLILGFSVPLLFGYLFQQLYNVVDTMIVGRFLGVDALAAVGATGSVNFLIIGFCNGVCSGFALPVAHRFGAKDYKSLRKLWANSIWFSAVFAIVMTTVTVVLCRWILRVMQTPENIMEYSYQYILVIFLGIPATYLFNLTSGMIRTLGNSRVPLVVLVISSVLNVVMDLVFILNFHMGVSGAALATVLSQLIAGIICVIYIVKKVTILHLEAGEWKPHKRELMELFNAGVPMGLQYSITAVGSVILQTAVNTLGSAAVASVTAASKISMFIVCPFDSMGATMATYGGQNAGGYKLDRLHKGLGSCVILGAVYSVIALGIIQLFGSSLLQLFVDAGETEILKDAHQFLLMNGLFYFPLALVNIVRFMIQGMGFGAFAILAGVLEMAARTLIGIVFVPMFGFTAACFASPLAWIFADAFLIPAYFSVWRKMKRQLEKSV